MLDIMFFGFIKLVLWVLIVVGCIGKLVWCFKRLIKYGVGVFSVILRVWLLIVFIVRFFVGILFLLMVFVFLIG